MPLSVDLRKRVIEAVDDGIRISDIVENFKISRRVIYNWLGLRKQTGSLKAKSGYQKGHSHSITDWEKFHSFAEAQKHCTIVEMVIQWNKLSDQKTSKSSIQRALSKIGYTSKKNLSVQRSGSKKTRTIPRRNKKHSSC